jgi:hypothetical protein
MLVLSLSLMAGDIPLVIKALASTRCVGSEVMKKPHVYHGGIKKSGDGVPAKKPVF